MAAPKFAGTPSIVGNRLALSPPAEAKVPADPRRFDSGTTDSGDGPERHRTDPLRSDPTRDYLRYSSLGIEFTLYLCVFAFLGWWIDGLLDLRSRFPVFLVLGVFLGMFAGIYRLNRILGPKSGHRRRGAPDDGQAPRDPERPDPGLTDSDSQND